MEHTTSTQTDQPLHDPTGRLCALAGRRFAGHEVDDYCRACVADATIHVFEGALVTTNRGDHGRVLFVDSEVRATVRVGDRVSEWHPAHPGLVFRHTEGWDLMCDQHLAEIEAGLVDLRARRAAERATSASGSWDDVVCPCGNAPHLDGFFTSDAFGTYATPYAIDPADPDPAPVWEGSIATCYRCGRIHDERDDGRILGRVDVADLLVAAEADLSDQDRHVQAVR